MKYFPLWWSVSKLSPWWWVSSIRHSASGLWNFFACFSQKYRRNFSFTDSSICRPSCSWSSLQNFWERLPDPFLCCCTALWFNGVVANLVPDMITSESSMTAKMKAPQYRKAITTRKWMRSLSAHWNLSVQCWSFRCKRSDWQAPLTVSFNRFRLIFTLLRLRFGHSYLLFWDGYRHAVIVYFKREIYIYTFSRSCCYFAWCYCVELLDDWDLGNFSKTKMEISSVCAPEAIWWNTFVTRFFIRTISKET